MNLKIRGTVEELKCVLDQMAECGMTDNIGDQCSLMSITDGLGLVVEDGVVFRDGYGSFDYPEVVLSGWPSTPEMHFVSSGNMVGPPMGPDEWAACGKVHVWQKIDCPSLEGRWACYKDSAYGWVAVATRFAVVTGRLVAELDGVVVVSSTLGLPYTILKGLIE